TDGVGSEQGTLRSRSTISSFQRISPIARPEIRAGSTGQRPEYVCGCFPYSRHVTPILSPYAPRFSRGHSLNGGRFQTLILPRQERSTRQLIWKLLSELRPIPHQ